MATKFYLPSTGGAAATPAYSASWYDTASASPSKLAAVTTKISSAMATKTLTDADLTDRHYCFGMWVSAPLAAQTILAQTIGISIKCSEDNAKNNLSLHGIIRVVQNDGVTYRGTLMTFWDDVTELPLTASVASRYYSATSSELAVSVGDRIVIELGLGGDPASGGGSHNSTMIIGDNAANDLDAADADVGIDNPWVNFANTLSFLKTQSTAGTLSSAGTISKTGQKITQGTLSTIGTITKRAARSFAGALSSNTGILSSLATRCLTLLGQIPSTTHSLLTDLSVYWKLDEESGTRYDSYGDIDLTDVNTVGSGPGNFGTAAKFVGTSNEYLNHVDCAELRTGNIDFTFACWAKQTIAADKMIFAKDDNGKRDYTLVGRAANVEFYVNGGWGAQSPWTYNQWHFVVCWHDATADTTNIQVDNGTIYSTSTGGGAPVTTTAEFQVGARAYPTIEGYFTGLIQYLGFWKRKLTAAEKTQLYEGKTYPFFTPWSGTVARLPNKLAVGVLSSTGTIIKRLSKGITGILSSVGSVIKVSAKSVITGTLASSASVTINRVFSKSLAGIAAFSGNTIKRVNRSLYGALGGSSLISDLISYWKLDEESGTRYDSHATNHLVDWNTVGYDIGKIGNAASVFSGRFEMLRLDNWEALYLSSDESVTISFWIKADTSKGVYPISAPYEVYASPDNVISFYLYDINSNLVGTITTPCSTGVWHHVCCWYDSSLKTTNMQVDGGDIHTALTGDFEYIPYETFGYLSLLYTGMVSSEIPSLLDCFGVWKRVLSPNERSTLRGAGTPPEYPWDTDYEWVGLLTKRISMSISAALSTVGAITKTLSRIVAGTLTSAGVVIKDSLKLIVSTLVSTADLVTQKVAGLITKTVSSVLTMAGAITVSSSKYLSGALLETGAILTRAVKLLTGELLSAGVQSGVRVVLLVLSATLNSAGSVVKAIKSSVAGMLIATGGMTKRVERLVSGVLSSAGTVVKLISKQIAGALGGSQSTLLNGLISYWKLNETSGTRNDAHSTNHLTDVNTVGYGTGKQGNAASFVATNNEYLKVVDNASLSRGAGDWTVSAWVRFTTAAATHVIVLKSTAWAFASFEYALYTTADPRWRFAVGNGASGTYVENNITFPVADTWYHIIGWHDATAGKLYVCTNDGVVYSANWVGGSQDGAGDLCIGSSPLTTYATQLVDCVCIWSRVLTAAERTALYGGGSPSEYPFGSSSAMTGTISRLAKKSIAGVLSLSASVVKRVSKSIYGIVASSAGALLKQVRKAISGALGVSPSSLLTGLVSYWKLDETTGTRYDSHGTNHLTDVNTVGYVTGKHGNAADFTYLSNESLTIADNPSVSVGNIDFVVSAWVYFHETTTSYQLIVGKGNIEWWLYVQNDSKISFLVHDGATYNMVKSVPISLGQWYHVVGWHDSTLDTLNIEVNGVASTPVVWTTGCYDGGGLFGMGHSIGGDREAFHVDCVGFWKGRILTPEERIVLRGGGSPPEYPFTSSSWIGAISKGVRKVISGILAPSGNVLKRIGSMLTGILTSDGSLTKNVSKLVFGIISGAGIILSATSKGIAATLAPVTGTLARMVLKPLSGILLESGTVLKETMRSLIGALTFTGVESAIGVRRTLTAALSLAGGITKQTSTAVNGLFSAAGSLIRLTAKSLSGVLISSGTVIGDLISRVLYQAVAGTLGAAGTLTKKVSKTITGPLALVGSVTKATARTLSGGLTAVGSVVKQLPANISGYLVQQGDITIKSLRTVLGSLIATGQLVKRTTTALSASFLFFAIITKRTANSFTAFLGSSGYLDQAREKILMAILAMSGAVNRSTAKRILGSLRSIGSIIIGYLVPQKRKITATITSRFIEAQIANRLIDAAIIDNHIEASFSKIITASITDKHIEADITLD